jgi:RNA polymerase sigma-70 factor (ECF subfamily)
MSPDVEQLWAELGHDLRGFIRARVRDHAAAEDILQDVFVKIHTRLPDLRDRERVGPWVYQIARNAVADHFRRERPTEELPAELDEPTESADAERPDLRPAVARFLDVLPAEDREALRLTEFEGLSQRELAGRLGISVSGAKSRVQRARARLREQLEQCCRFEFDRRGNIIEAHARPATAPQPCCPAKAGDVATASDPACADGC